MDFVGSALPLDDSAIDAVADDLGCSRAAILAVRQIEAAGSGFLPDRRPKILFEAHIFYRLTDGVFGISNISVPHWDRSTYGAAGAHQYDRLMTAIYASGSDMPFEEQRAAAFKSASWGMFQILGENHKAAGYDTVESFVLAMTESEGKQLAAFASFCKTNNLARFLRDPPDFARFARGYNGPGYAQNGYDTKLADAYAANQ